MWVWDQQDRSKRLGIDGALELGAGETASQDLTARAARLLGKRIESRDYDVLSRRVGLSGPEKLSAIARLWLGAALLGRARAG